MNQDVQQFVTAALERLDEMPAERRISLLTGCSDLCSASHDAWVRQVGHQAAATADAIREAERHQLRLLAYTNEEDQIDRH